MADLDRLDRFATSLQLETLPPEAITHPYRLYQLLCQAARLYFDFNTTPPWPADAPKALTQSQTNDPTVYWGGLEVADGFATHGVYDWSSDNQQIMGWLSGDAML